MNTQENNKMIAEFMGYELIGNTYSKNNGMDWFIEPQYHESWNWLMSVVEKIKNIAVKNDNIEVFYEVANHIPDRHETYKSVVEFINEYNKNK